VIKQKHEVCVCCEGTGWQPWSDRGPEWVAEFKEMVETERAAEKVVDDFDDAIKGTV
jgi:hypothetical protein